MSTSDPHSGVSLSGLWHGQFSYPAGAPAEFFRATLLETPDWLSGSTQEVSQFGKSKGKTLYATLRGRRDGNAVSFVKTYESQTRTHSVNYAGTLNGDATEIEGIWTVPGFWSGKFLMIRESGIKGTVHQGVRETIGMDR